MTSTFAANAYAIATQMAQNATVSPTWTIVGSSTIQNTATITTNSFNTGGTGSSSSSATAGGTGSSYQGNVMNAPPPSTGPLARRIRQSPVRWPRDAMTPKELAEYKDIHPHEKLGFGLYRLPDGTRLSISPVGLVEIDDKDAKVFYRSAPRDFNAYLNASDMLERFLGYVGEFGMTAHEALHLPLDLFISWLIVSAAEQDGEPEPAYEIKKLTIALVPVKQRPKEWRRHTARCRGCGRFLSQRRASNHIDFCSGEHMDRFFARAA